MTMRPMTTVLLSLMLCATGRGATTEPTWPQFHGPARDNLSTETGLLTQWPEGGPALLWTFAECGQGYAGVSVAGGKILTAGYLDGKECVLALDLEGKLLWQSPNGKAWRGSTPGARATPTLDGDLAYHMSAGGRLAAFQIATGKEVWAVDLCEAYGTRPSTWGMSENVLLDGDKLLCTPAGPKGRVVALDKKTGKPVWANTEIEDGAAYSSPIIVDHNGVRQFITLLRRTVVGVDVGSGKLLWSHEHPNRYNQNVTRPVFHDGTVFVTSGHKAGGRMLQINPKSDGVRQLWHSGEFDNCHGGVLRLGGHLYGSGCRLYHKGLLCVDARTGKTVYRAEKLGKVSTTYADGLLYSIDQTGVTSLVKVDPQAAVVRGQFRIPMVGKDHSLAHPVVCGGRLYLRQDKNLFAYDVSRDD